jgi:peptide chain release factor 1
LKNRQVQEKRLKQLNDLLVSPEIINDHKKCAEVSKEYKKLERLMQQYRRLDKTRKEIAEAKEILASNDEEMKEVAHHEIKGLEKRLESIESEIDEMLNPQYEEYQKNCIVEIRAGTGGDEASLFAAELFRMYTKYGEKRKLKYEVLSSHSSDIGGFKEIIFLASGKDAYGLLHFEKGIHRVQRVPLTEAGGRIHTSAVTVVVLPEIEEAQFEIKQDDLKIDTFRAGGHGGQNVNKVSSAVRITHLPSGMVVSCQDERSQHKNRAKAMKILRARLAASQHQKQQAEIDKDRRQQVGSGERSEKIRTYNYPQNRVTDHRIGLTLYKLDRIREGDLDEIIEGLKENERNRRAGN